VSTMLLAIAVRNSPGSSWALPIAIFCGTCPVGQNIDCPHAGQPGVPGWPYADIKKVRIDPTARLA